MFVEPFWDHGLGLRGKSIHNVRASSSISRRCRRRHIVRVLGGDTECPLQVCQLSRSSESTQFLSLRRDVALVDSTRAPDGFWDQRHVPPIYFLTILNIKRQPYHTKPMKSISIRIITGFSRSYLNTRRLRSSLYLGQNRFQKETSSPPQLSRPRCAQPNMLQKVLNFRRLWVTELRRSENVCQNVKYFV